VHFIPASVTVAASVLQVAIPIKMLLLLWWDTLYMKHLLQCLKLVMTLSLKVCLKWYY